MTDSIKITYESLFELLRNEKNREELQTLDKDFFNNIIEYIKEKKKILEKSDDNLFVASEREKTIQQIQNIKKIIKELLQRREKKIISMALIKSRTSADVDTNNLLEEEKTFFIDLLMIFDNFRNNIVKEVLEERTPKTESLKKRFEKQLEEKGREKEQRQEQSKDIKDQLKQDREEKQKTSESSNDTDIFYTNNSVVRILEYIPSFLANDLNNYGPFEPEDIACLPNKIIALLIKKGAAEKISTG